MHEAMQLIERTRKARGISRAKMAKLCGFGENAYYQYLTGTQPTIGRVDTMLSVLGITYTLGERRTKNDAGDLYDS